MKFDRGVFRLGLLAHRHCLLRLSEPGREQGQRAEQQREDGEEEG